MSQTESKGQDRGPDMSSIGPLFVQLVLSFHAAAWQQMGKVVSVVTGKMERELRMAKHSIDMLGMLEEKTKGNLTEDELKYLQQVLYELRMNYLDEMKKEPEKSREDKQDDSGGDKPPADGEDETKT